MKKTTLALLTAALLTATSGSARKQPVPKMYLFGMAASFTDTIVHFTAIQQLDSAWVDSKSHFLQERQAYSYQLKHHLEKQQMPKRTCMVFYSEKKEKLEKKYQKMQQLYTKSKDGQRHFDVRYLTPQDFQFYTVSAEIIEEGADE